MLKRKVIYDIDMDTKYKERISSLFYKDGSTFIGREDGILECYQNNTKYRIKCFETEFDYLENEDIKEKIVDIEKMNDGGIYDLIFVANEKVLKIFKCKNEASNIDICNSKYSEKYTIKEYGKYSNVHSYVLNSISLNSTNEYMLSSDYIRINLWKPSRMENMFLLRDLKKQLTGGNILVINSSKFSPFHDNIYGYSTSSGEILLNDLEITPHSDTVLTFKNIKCDGIRSISDFSFVDSNLIAARSLNHYMLFDIRNDTQPVFIKELANTVNDQNLLNSSETIYERFKISCNGMYAYTGSFFNSVYQINILSSNIEEITIGEKREFCINNKTKHVICGEEGFSCSMNGKFISYEPDYY